ncbi:MAG: redox-sensing transcriptional repressor Rex, partial [Clostridia bacterium]|nr:redox-sensing transcriptional repressor Rex [Clostridia bacterium]
DEKNAVIIGAGNLGQAIINNFDFFQNGFRLIAAFDADPALIGTEISGVPVYDVKTLREYCSKNHPDVGVLTMPKIYAREIAGILCDCGISGIWNFTNTDLHLDIDAVPVENVHFAESLMVLSYKIGEKK